MCLPWHRRNNHGDRGRLVPPTFRLGGTNNVLVPLNFLAVVFKKQEISQQVLLLLNENQSFHVNYSALCRHFSRYSTSDRRKTKKMYLIPVSNTTQCIFISLSYGVPWQKIHAGSALKCILNNFNQSINQFNSNLAAREPDSKWYAVEIIDKNSIRNKQCAYM